MSEQERAWWIVAAVVAVLFAAVAAVLAGHALAGPGEGPSAPSAHYLEVREECEQRATLALPAQYAPGGQHWVDTVNACSGRSSVGARKWPRIPARLRARGMRGRMFADGDEAG